MRDVKVINKLLQFVEKIANMRRYDMSLKNYTARYKVNDLIEEARKLLNRKPDQQDS